MLVKHVTKEYYEELIEVWESSVRATHHFLPEENILELKPLISQHYFDAVELLCITKNSEIAGFIGVANANVEMLFVNPKYFGQGFGSQLRLRWLRQYRCFSDKTPSLDKFVG